MSEGNHLGRQGRSGVWRNDKGIVGRAHQDAAGLGRHHLQHLTLAVHLDQPRAKFVTEPIAVADRLDGLQIAAPVRKRPGAASFMIGKGTF